jgi:ankyrin repeat and fibronectin type-III domain-containing protein 1
MCFDLEKYGSNLSEAQQIFIDSLKLSLNRLFKFMNVSVESAFQHRLYDVEVVHLSDDVTFLLICSPLSENAIVTKGKRKS